MCPHTQTFVPAHTRARAHARAHTHTHTHTNTHTHTCAQTPSAPPNRPQEVTLSDLQQLAVLGAGGFGKVTLVKHKASAAAAAAAAPSGAFYALKQMTKAYIKAQGLVRHVHREKQVRAGCWIVCLG